MKLNALQKALTTHYSTHMPSVDRFLGYMPSTPEAGVAYVWQADDWIAPGEGEGTWCRPSIVTYSIDVLASLVVDSQHSQAWLNDVVDEALAAPDFQGNDDRCWPVRIPRLRIVQTENGQRFLNASIALSPIALES